MNPADQLAGRDRAAELLRQALDTLEALPFSEPATPLGIEQLKQSRDAVVLGLRALGEDPRQPSRAEVDPDRPAEFRLFNCSCRYCTVGHTLDELADTADAAIAAQIAVTPAANPGEIVTAARVAGEAHTPQALAPAPGVTGIECVGCGTTFVRPTLEGLRDAYVEHVPECPHDRSPHNGWNAPLDVLFGAADRFTNAATRR